MGKEGVYNSIRPSPERQVSSEWFPSNTASSERVTRKLGSPGKSSWQLVEPFSHHQVLQTSSPLGNSRDLLSLTIRCPACRCCYVWRHADALTTTFKLLDTPSLFQRRIQQRIYSPPPISLLAANFFFFKHTLFQGIRKCTLDPTYFTLPTLSSRQAEISTLLNSPRKSQNPPPLLGSS